MRIQTDHCTIFIKNKCANEGTVCAARDVSQVLQKRQENETR